MPPRGLEMCGVYRVACYDEGAPYISFGDKLVQGRQHVIAVILFLVPKICDEVF